MTAPQKSKAIQYIVIHCTAGHTSAEKVQDYFTRSRDKGGRGWKTGGYHRIIEKDGTIKKMYDFEKTTNGVRGYNLECIHISYVGGVNDKDYRKAQDTRTHAQKLSIEKCIKEAIEWLESHGRDVRENLMILGHRDFSKDRNGNGIIESWERIKECPSFDAMQEYHHIYGATNQKYKLPAHR
jgi:N-acetylmuramoyl-L-alanine amidase